MRACVCVLAATLNEWRYRRRFRKNMRWLCKRFDRMGCPRCTFAGVCVCSIDANVALTAKPKTSFSKTLGNIATSHTRLFLLMGVINICWLILNYGLGSWSASALKWHCCWKRETRSALLSTNNLFLRTHWKQSNLSKFCQNVDLRNEMYNVFEKPASHHYVFKYLFVYHCWIATPHTFD